MRTLAEPRALLVGLALLPWCAVGQTSFDAASIKPAVDPFGGRLGFMKPVMDAGVRPGMIPMPDPGRVALRNMSLLSLVARAYRVSTTRVNGPAWMDEEQFDVYAKVPAGAPKDQVNEMLQSLLKERFGLVAHRELKDLPGYALLVGKGGVKLTQSAPPGEPSAGQDAMADRVAALQRKLAGRERSAPPPPPGVNRFRFQGIDAEQLADILSRFAQGPVVDMTGLKGTYAVTLDVSTDQDYALDSIFEATEKLGLKLEHRRVLTDTLVVDKVAKAPTPN
jgi:uncharacterized protein (TIGR03435 family)